MQAGSHTCTLGAQRMLFGMCPANLHPHLRKQQPDKAGGGSKRRVLRLLRKLPPVRPRKRQKLAHESRHARLHEASGDTSPAWPAPLVLCIAQKGHVHSTQPRCYHCKALKKIGLHRPQALRSVINSGPAPRQEAMQPAHAPSRHREKGSCHGLFRVGNRTSRPDRRSMPSRRCQK